MKTSTHCHCVAALQSKAERAITMSAKVNMECPPREPDCASVAPPAMPTPSPGEAILLCGVDSGDKKPRPQTHMTTALLLPGDACNTVILHLKLYIQ